jgi:hypothetical protein
MKKLILACALALGLSACASNGGTNQLLTNLQGCERTYQGALGGMPGTNKVNVTIRCEPGMAQAAAVPAIAPPTAPVLKAAEPEVQ